MNICVKRRILIILMLFGCLLPFIRVFADTPDGMLVINSYTYGVLQPNVNSAHNSVGTYDIVVFTQDTTNSDNYYMTFRSENYKELDQDDKETFMETLLKGIANNSSLTPVYKNKVYNFIESQDESIAGAMSYLKQDVDADFIEARKWFEPFSGPISTFMGFCCIVIFSGLAISIVFDVVYLNIPLIQPLLERGEEDKKPWGVSNEAWKANKIVNEGNTDKSAMSIYLKRRIPVFFLTAAILAWLISGKIYDLVVYFIDWYKDM